MNDFWWQFSQEAFTSWLYLLRIVPLLFAAPCNGMLLLAATYIEVVLAPNVEWERIAKERIRTSVPK